MISLFAFKKGTTSYGTEKSRACEIGVRDYETVDYTKNKLINLN